MQMADRKLWEVMADAYCNANNMPTSRTGMMRSGIAAELRDLADEVVPDSEVPLDHEIAIYGLHVAWIRWAARYETRIKLLKAAAEAEGKADG
jgi:hypothetical protein